MSKTQDDGGSPGRFIVGVLLGVATTAMYVKFDEKLPGFLQLGSKVNSAAIVTTAEADLFNPKAAHDVRRRALSVALSQQPDVILEIDQQLDGALLEEYLRREAVRRAKQKKQLMGTYDTALKQNAVRRRLEARWGTTDTESLKRAMLLGDVNDDAFLIAYLKQRFPKALPERITDLVLTVYDHEFRPNRVAANADAQTKQDAVSSR